MLQLLFRKFQSLNLVLKEEKDPWRMFWSKLDENIRSMIVSIQNTPFIYSTKLNSKFLCIPHLPNSRNLYVYQKNYEEVELKIAQNWLRVDDCCIDLGANIGYFSALFASTVQNQGLVIAVEASPKTTDYLDLAVRQLELSQVRVESVCITDHNDRVIFMEGDGDVTDVRQALVVEFAEDFVPIEVESTTIDSLIKKHDVEGKVALVKMDIEGAEPLALKGALLLFHPTALPLFIVEIYKIGLERMNFDPKNITDYFDSEQFELYWVNRSYPNPSKRFLYGQIYKLFDLQNHEWLWHSNLIAVPKIGRFSSRIALIEKLLKC